MAGTPPKVPDAHPPQGANSRLGTPPTRGQKNGTLLVLECLRAGRPPSTLYKSGKVPRRSVMRALSELKSVGLIKRVGLAWEVFDEPANDKNARCQIVHRVARTHTPPKVPKLKPDTARAHGIMAVVKVPIKNFTSDMGNGEKFASWSKDNLAQVLEARKIDFIHVPQGLRIQVLDVEKVWLTSKSVVFYLPYSWYGENAHECAVKVMEDTIRLIRRLERMLGIAEQLKAHGSYWIKFSRQHDALIKNAIAELYGKPGKPFVCRDEIGQWLLIDNSLNLHEMETTRGEKEYQPIKPDKPLEPQIRENDGGAREHFKAMQKFLNSQKANPDITADFIKDMFAQTATQIQEVNGHMGHYSRHLRTHVQSIETLGSSVNTLSLQSQENAKTTATLREAVQRLAASLQMVNMPIAEKERLVERAKKQAEKLASEPVRTLKNCALCGQRAKIAGLYCPECAGLVKDWKKPGRMSSLDEFSGGLT